MDQIAPKLPNERDLALSLWRGFSICVKDTHGSSPVSLKGASVTSATSDSNRPVQ